MKTKIPNAFSLVEVLAAITIIGVVVFLAIPNIVQIRQDSEANLATARAASLDVAISSFIQANGRASANSLWTSAATDSAKFLLVKPYLAFAESNFTLFQPSGYSMAMPASVSPPTKVTVSGPGL